MAALDDIEAIRQLKYRYFRCLDCKRWDELAACFTADATAAYDSGKYSYNGRTAIMEFLSGALGSSAVISLHQGHHPDIEILSPTQARGTWYLEDYLIFTKANTRLRGAAFYHDEYVKEDVWKIKHTGYIRTFEEILNGNDEAPRWTVTASGDHLPKKA